jgi:phosphatidylglycerol lysyltransferase
LIDTIPLSWLRCDTAYPRFKSVRLPLSGLTWIHSAEIPFNLSFEKIFAELVNTFGEGILIRGCRSEIAGFLMGREFTALRTGAEALIDLGSHSGTLTAAMGISRRGMRWGGVEEVTFTEASAERFSRLRSASAHGRKPQLRYLYHTGLDPSTRCFVYRTPGDRWLGAVTVSESARSLAHTEMILRDRDAPPGVMEALFAGTMDILKEEGFKEFSLGEVPFVSDSFDSATALNSGQHVKEKVLFCTGYLLKYAYNFENLFRFKNKFRPVWRPVYICAPKMPWSALADMFVESGFHALSGSALISSVKGRANSLLQFLS